MMECHPLIYKTRRSGINIVLAYYNEQATRDRRNNTQNDRWVARGWGGRGVASVAANDNQTEITETMREERSEEDDDDDDERRKRSVPRTQERKEE